MFLKTEIIWLYWQFLLLLLHFQIELDELQPPRNMKLTSTMFYWSTNSIFLVQDKLIKIVYSKCTSCCIIFVKMKTSMITGQRKHFINNTYFKCSIIFTLIKLNLVIWKLNILLIWKLATFCKISATIIVLYPSIFLGCTLI